MKKILQLVMVCAGIGIFALSSTSCSTEYDANPAIPGRDTMKNPMRGDFTATVEGVTFVANSKYVSDNTIDGVRTITISGTMDSYDKDPKYNQSISLAITNYNGPNTYPIQFGVSGVYVSREEGVAKTYLAKAGDTAAYITITNDAGSLSGSFNFVVAPNGLGTADNININNGSFNISK